jgi:2-polyprenyl-3-methyl-5-hydroxy-6-metoxy-1,4-benzoquinol methylase
MKLGLVPKGIVEWLVLRFANPPIPVLHTLIVVILARAVMVATKLGVFDALEGQELDAEELARRCGSDVRATEVLAKALACTGYLTTRDGRYALSKMARRWLPEARPDSLHDSILFSIHEAEVLTSMEDYVRSGQALDLHQGGMNDEQWGSYQRGMRSRQAGHADEVGRRTPVPKGARRMLDIGGSHGLFSVTICKRHPGLDSVILDLPEAIKHAAPLLAAEGMGDRIVHKAGNALTDDLGTEAYDIVFMSHVAHHFDDATNRRLAKKIAKSLRPGGVYVIQESIRTEQPSEHNQLGGLLDLYFAMISRSGTWAFDEMAAWQREAGLTPQRPLPLRLAPGTGQQAGIKS